MKCSRAVLQFVPKPVKIVENLAVIPAVQDVLAKICIYGMTQEFVFYRVIVKSSVDR